MIRVVPRQWKREWIQEFQNPSTRETSTIGGVNYSPKVDTISPRGRHWRASWLASVCCDSSEGFSSCLFCWCVWRHSLQYLPWDARAPAHTHIGTRVECILPATILLPQTLVVRSNWHLTTCLAFAASLEVSIVGSCHCIRRTFRRTDRYLELALKRTPRLFVPQVVHLFIAKAATASLIDLWSEKQSCGCANATGK